MKKFLAIFILPILLLSSCEYKIALADINSKVILDKKLLGVWHKVDNGKGSVENLIILPINEYRYLVVFPHGGGEDMYAIAEECNVRNLHLIQLKWIGNVQGETCDDGRFYQYLKYEIGNNELKIMLLNSTVVSKFIDSKKVLENTIINNIENPDLFKKPMFFKKDSDKKSTQ